MKLRCFILLLAMLLPICGVSQSMPFAFKLHTAPAATSGKILNGSVTAPTAPTGPYNPLDMQIAWYDFNSTNAAGFPDRSSNNCVALTNYGNVVWKTNYNWFGGTDGYMLDTSTAKVFTNLSPAGVSWSFWVTRDSPLGDNERFFEWYNRNGSYTDELTAWTVAINDVYWLPWVDASFVNGGAWIHATNWTHVVMVFNLTNTAVYIGGELFDSKSHSLQIPFSLVGTYISFGQYLPVPGAYNWTGGMDDYRVWRRELTTNEIMNLKIGGRQ